MKQNYVDQTLNLDSIRRFLSRHESIFLFLALSLVLTILLVVLGQPTVLTEFTSQQTTMTPLGQVSIGLTSGFFTLVISRMVLLLVNRWRELSPIAFGIWLITEMLLCVSVIVLVLWGLGGGGQVELAPLVAYIVLGFIGILLIPYVITFLVYRTHEMQQEILRLRQLVDNHGSLAPAATDAIINFYDKGNRLAFSTKKSNVLYIEAADNYVNIHYTNDEKEETFILHNSLKEMEKRFTNTSLVRCHRGYMVNVDNVKLMRKENLGLMLELVRSAKPIPVSKSYAKPITQHFASNTEIPLPNEQK